MSGAQIVSFEDAIRARGADDQHVVSEAELRSRQATVPLADCHAAFDRVTYEIRTKRRRIPIFYDLSIAIPKNRKIVIFGHKGSGKSTLFNMLLRQAPPTRGDVIVNSRLSWPIHLMSFMDPRLSVRANAIFTARILGVEPRGLLASMLTFAELEQKAADDPIQSMTTVTKRRLGIIVVLAANFDCLLIDSPFRSSAYGLSGDEGQSFEDMILSHDYMIGISSPRHAPANANLAFLLYEGHVYQFDDVQEAAAIFGALPVPADTGGGQQKSSDDEDDDEVREEVY
ncbi:ATP-binding cassette domain-containing protein [Acuticoccus sp. M5D2P5]|uniref:ATP-binding cassette domain-containing protein n=1 Tax=Acuticoccus kalidii TaxID=2910977 RepID=UPI001F23BE89|nr:ATP-binding cassette domain-containing protein [Acuticoccus kalidii]MCF3936325.1 ATP-binding cassette domain-containing protein [Acuticoccus kalidii]